MSFVAGIAAALAGLILGTENLKDDRKTCPYRDWFGYLLISLLVGHGGPVVVLLVDFHSQDKRQQAPDREGELRGDLRHKTLPIVPIHVFAGWPGDSIWVRFEVCSSDLLAINHSRSTYLS